MITLAPVAVVVLVAWSLFCVLIGWWLRNARAEVAEVEHRHAAERLQAEVNRLERELLDAEHRAISWDPTSLPRPAATPEPEDASGEEDR